MIRLMGVSQRPLSRLSTVCGVLGSDVELYSIDDVISLPWSSSAIDLVLECTGAFSDRATAEQHLQAGANRVLFSQPAEPDVDLTVVWGINHHQLRAQQRIVSAGSLHD